MAHTAGDWLRLADQVNAVVAELTDTAMAHWAEALGFLSKDLQHEAGRVGELEVEAWQDAHFPDRRAA